MLKQACVILVSSHVNTKVSGAAADLILPDPTFSEFSQSAAKNESAAYDRPVCCVFAKMQTAVYMCVGATLDVSNILLTIVLQPV